jgi:hypothetical protein
MRTTLLLAGAVSGLMTASAAFAEREVVHEFHTSVPRGAVRTVVIDLPVAETRITNGPSDALSVSGNARREYANSGERPSRQRSVDEAAVEIEVQGSQAFVRRRFGASVGGWTSAHIKFTADIQVPRGVNIDLRQKIGEVEIDGAFASVDVSLKVGEIRVRMPRANVRELRAGTTVGEVHADTGDRTLSSEGLFAGPMRWTNEGGKSLVNIELSIGEIRIELTR